MESEKPAPQTAAPQIAAPQIAAPQIAAPQIAAPQTTRFYKLILAGTLVFVVALVGKYFLFDYADIKHFDGAPLPRVPTNAPFIVSPDLVVNKMAEVANLTPDDVVFDLGCGDARIVITAVARSGARGVGFDIDPKVVAIARENVTLHNLQELVSIKEQDVFELDLREADVVMMYILPWMIKKLTPQFQKMKPGSRIISHDFGFANTNDIPPDETYEVEIPMGRGEFETHYVHVWIMPLKIPKGLEK